MLSVNAEMQEANIWALDILFNKLQFIYNYVLGNILTIKKYMNCKKMTLIKNLYNKIYHFLFVYNLNLERSQ